MLASKIPLLKSGGNRPIPSLELAREKKVFQICILASNGTIATSGYHAISEIKTHVAKVTAILERAELIIV